LTLWAACARAQGSTDNVLQEYDRKIRQKSAVLDSIKSELGRGRTRMAQLAKEEGTYLERLGLLEKNMETARRYLEEVGGRIGAVTRHIENLNDSLDAATRALGERQNTMRRRLRTMYKTGRFDMLYRVKYFQELKDYDVALVRAIDSTRIVIRAHTAAREEEREQLVALKKVKETEQITQASERAQHRQMLDKVRGEKKAYEQMVRELEQAQEELTLLLKSLQEKRTKAKVDYERGLTIAFEKRKGALPWPVEGAVMRAFGKIVHPVYKTITVNTGIDIEAKKGAKVFCVAPGMVDYVGWMRGYGKFVIVNHFGGYVTIYAHLDTIAVAADQEVEYGTALGVVGDTGSLAGPKLHFQIRKETEPMDPQEWLEQRE
jgi:septal ring factor EnvC (AmiA/AmiB activator)